ncbi:MAG: hypothetical protein Q8L64_02325 [bacterium]|nr:hypothetical protein [bacterium]
MKNRKLTLAGILKQSYVKLYHHQMGGPHRGRGPAGFFAAIRCAELNPKLRVLII